MAVSNSWGFMRKTVFPHPPAKTQSLVPPLFFPMSPRLPEVILGPLMCLKDDKTKKKKKKWRKIIQSTEKKKIFFQKNKFQEEKNIKAF